jgi:hypothetical protein
MKNDKHFKSEGLTPFLATRLAATQLVPRLRD